MRRAFSGWPRGAVEGETIEWSPSADISETDKEYLIRAELPAVKKAEVKVTVDGGMITSDVKKRNDGGLDPLAAIRSARRRILRRRTFMRQCSRFSPPLLPVRPCPPAHAHRRRASHLRPGSRLRGL